jgi:hypothetical protein
VMLLFFNNVSIQDKPRGRELIEKNILYKRIMNFIQGNNFLILSFLSKG